jgi:hypothetical protein
MLYHCASGQESQHHANGFVQEKSEQLRKERAISHELKKQLQHFSVVLSAATDHVEQLQSRSVAPSISGRSSRATSRSGR